MSDKKIIAVFGATGVVGGSVAKYLLEDGTFAVRAITRSATGDKAKALKAAGAEVVEADLNKPETLSAALAGVYGTSVLTDFWAIFGSNGYNAEKAQAGEEAQGRAIVDAAKKAGVQHFLYFSLPTSNVPHFEGKAVVEKYLFASGIPITTSVINAFYYDNIANPAFGMLKKEESGGYTLSIPIPADLYIPSYCAEQSGGWVLAAFKNPQQWNGKQLHAISSYNTPNEYAKAISAGLGAPVAVASPSHADFDAMAKSENPFVKEMYLNMKYFADYTQPAKSTYNGGDKAPEASAAIYPGQYDLQGFIQKSETFKKFAASQKA